MALAREKNDDLARQLLLLSRASLDEEDGDLKPRDFRAEELMAFLNLLLKKNEPPKATTKVTLPACRRRKYRSPSHFFQPTTKNQRRQTSRNEKNKLANRII
jgi:hypothetical protein